MTKERRKEDRIPLDKLPDNLKIIYFKLGDFGEFSAKTINASKSGLAFVSLGIFEKELKGGNQITIKIKPQNIKLKAELVYANKIFIDEIGLDLLKFGIKFSKTRALNKYQKLLADNIS